MLSLTFKTKSVYCNCIWYKINLSTTFGTKSVCCHGQSGHLHLEQNQSVFTCIQDKISFLSPTFATNCVVACILDTYIWNKINVLLPAFRDLHLEQNQHLVTCIQDTYIWNKIKVLLPVFGTHTSGTKSKSCYLYSGQDQFAVTYIWKKREL